MIFIVLFGTPYCTYTSCKYLQRVHYITGTLGVLPTENISSWFMVTWAKDEYLHQLALIMPSGKGLVEKYLKGLKMMMMMKRQHDINCHMSCQLYRMI